MFTQVQLSLFTLLFLLCLSSSSGLAIDLKNEDDQIAYSIGYITGENVKNQAKLGMQLNTSYVLNGFNDSINNSAQLTQEQIMNALNLLRKKQQAMSGQQLPQPTTNNKQEPPKIAAPNLPDNNNLTKNQSLDPVDNQKK